MSRPNQGWLGILALGLAVFLAWPGPGLAAQRAETGKKAAEGEVPLHISAARLEADQNNRVIIFSGQVKADYGNATLYADQLRIYYQPGKSAAPAGPAAPEGQEASPLSGLGGEKIDRIAAQGKVRFVQEDKVASGQEAIYYKDRDEVVLLGNPQVWQGENNLKGEKIIFNLKQNRVLVESSPRQRVEAHLYSKTKPEGLKSSGLMPAGKGGPKTQP